VTTLHAEPTEDARPRGSAGRWRSRLGSVELLVAVVVVAILLRGWLVDRFASPQASTFVTAFVSVLVAGLPFLVVGVAASAALAAFVSRRHLDRLLALPVHAAIPAAAGIGVVVPTGDDAPAVSARLARRAPAAAMAFLLSSPALSPVVLVATVVAFPGQPLMAVARLLAGLLTALAMGFLWSWLGRPAWLSPAPADPADPLGGWDGFWRRCRVQTVRAGGFLVLGALASAVLTAALPVRWLGAIAGSGLFAVIAMALLAVLLSVRADADAFVAAAVSMFPPTAVLAFLVVGPTANLRLFTRQLAAFGPDFAVRFAPVTFVVGVLAAVLVGTVLL
jgi:uncharacterized membrane protein YraQ (UPF0718 family)